MSGFEFFRNLFKINKKKKEKVKYHKIVSSSCGSVDKLIAAKKNGDAWNGANGHHRRFSFHEPNRNQQQRSTWSLRRAGSFGSQLIGKKKDVDRHLKDDVEIGDVERVIERSSATFCIYAELYQELNENGQLAMPINQHPKFIKFSHNRNVALFVSKACLECQQPGSMCIIHSVTNLLFRQVIRYFKHHDQSEQLNRLEFYLDGKNHCLEPIKDDTFANFSQFLGPSLREIRFLTKYKDLVKFGIRFDHSLTATFLSLLHVHSESYKSLVKFELVIADSSAVRFFVLFAKSLGQQLESLRIKFCPNIMDFDFPTIIIDVIRGAISVMKNLKTLNIDLLPNGLPQVSKVDLSWVLQEISELPINENIEQFGLGIDISHVNRNQLDLISCLSAFTAAHSLSLTVYADQYSTMNDFHLDFTPLYNTTNKLRELTIDCSSLSNSDLCQLAKICPQLTRLNIGCDNRIDRIALNALAKNLPDLKTLIIGKASTYQQADNSKQGLYIDNDDLCVFLSHAPKRLQSLRTIKLAHSRIQLEGCIELVDHIRSWALSKPDEMFWLILENNRFPLMEECSFKEMYDIPANLQFKWIYKRVKQETSL